MRNPEHFNINFGRLILGQQNIELSKKDIIASEEEQCLYVLSHLINLPAQPEDIDPILLSHGIYQGSTQVLWQRKPIELEINIGQKDPNRTEIQRHTVKDETENQLKAIFNYFDSKINLASIKDFPEVQQWIKEWKPEEEIYRDYLNDLMKKKYEAVTEASFALAERPIITLVAPPFVRRNWTSKLPTFFDNKELEY